MTIPRLRSAKSMTVINERCISSIANQIHGRNLRDSASGAKNSSKASAPQVSIRNIPSGRLSRASRTKPGRANGFPRTWAIALPSTQDGLTSFV